MDNLIKTLVSTANKFTGKDYAVFKICLLSIGILLGTYFSGFFLNYICFVWIVAVISYIILMIPVIKNYRKVKG